MIKEKLIRYLVIAAVIVGLEPFKFWIWLGAHPFWSLKVAYIGVAVGVAVAWTTSFLIDSKRTTRTSAIAILVVAAGFIGTVSWYGKSEFAASFAENTMAGRLWYYSFIAFVAVFFATLSELSYALIKPLDFAQEDDE